MNGQNTIGSQDALSKKLKFRIELGLGYIYQKEMSSKKRLMSLLSIILI
jgi:hypothetical protein